MGLFISYLFLLELKISEIFFMAGMKVIETNENELIMEPSIRWAGNPNIVLSVKVQSLRVRIQVRIDYIALRSPSRENLLVFCDRGQEILMVLPLSLWICKCSQLLG